MIEEWAARSLSFAAGVVIIALVEPRINLMAPAARPGFRYAFLALAVGAVWSMLEVVDGIVPSWGAVILRLGIAALLLEERHCPRNCAGMTHKHKTLKIVRTRRDHDMAAPPRA